jgi:hypothetical protein
MTYCVSAVSLRGSTNAGTLIDTGVKMGFLHDERTTGVKTAGKELFAGLGY